MAQNGLSSVLMYLIPAVFFLVPTALVGAELATTYKGGVYVWVREAFGNRMGFTAIWLQWIQNVVWFPIQLAFVGAALAFTIGKGSLADSGLYTGVVIIIVYWLATLIALRGGDLFAKVGSWGGLIGTLAPAGVLIVLGGLWIFTDKPVAQSFTDSTWVSPGITGIGSIVLLVSNVLAYAGMEMNAVHAGDMANPRKDYTKAMLIAFILILGIFIVPTLAISYAIPADQLGVDNGIMVAFQSFFDAFGVGWLSNVLAGMIVVGALASVVTWVAGPSRGLLDAARTGLLPPAMQQRNGHGIQIGILIPQGLIVTALALLYVVVPDVSDVLLALIGMAAALYVLMYLMMFAAAIRLRKTEPDAPRGYKVPALTAIAGAGFIACVLAFVLSFIPAGSESVIPASLYPVVVAVVVIVLGVPPLIFYALKKPTWDQRTDEEKAEDAHH
jgi:amino acid transporter